MMTFKIMGMFIKRMNREQYLGFYDINQTKRGGTAKGLCQCNQEDNKNWKALILSEVTQALKLFPLSCGFQSLTVKYAYPGGSKYEENPENQKEAQVTVKKRGSVAVVSGRREATIERGRKGNTAW